MDLKNSEPFHEKVRLAFKYLNRPIAFPNRISHSKSFHTEKLFQKN